jgi:hypothetical protein
MNFGTFSRFDLFRARTVAFTRFNTHHTELNDFYWSFIPAFYFSLYKTNDFSPESITQNALVLSGPDARRPPTTMEEWRTGLKNFANWTRLSMVLSATSYLEVYVRQIATLALASDPLVMYGLPGQLDGVTLIKRGTKLDLDKEIVTCCRGTWPERYQIWCDSLEPFQRR